MSQDLDNRTFAGHAQRRLAALDLYAGRVDEWAGTRTTAALDVALDRLASPAAAAVGTAANPDRSLRLPADQFRPDRLPKTLIVLHHTVGAGALSTFRWWATTRERIGTAFLIERDGRVYETFDPRSWAHHLGIPGAGAEVERRSIGIELCSEGGLTPGSDGEVHAFGVIADRTIYRGPVYDHGEPWRGFQRFASYTALQLAAAYDLVNLLCAEMGVPRRTPADHLAYDPGLLDFEGVVGHHLLRREKSDVHPGFPWAELAAAAALDLA